MSFDFVGLAISFASIYGIYAILSISLNLEYGFAGQPNFGQVLFYGLGAFASAIAAANLLPLLAHQSISSICDTNAIVQRGVVAANNPSVSLSTWAISLVVAITVGALTGYVLSYPGTRLKQEWFLAMVLLVAGNIFVIVVNNTPQFGCGFNGVPGLLTPFTWLANDLSIKYTSINPTLPNYVSTGIYALIILIFAAACYFVAERLAKSPYGRLLKSMRDDYVAAESLGKDISKLRKQIMVIGSAMAGLAGGLYVFYIGVATTEDYVSSLTFSLFVIVILGGYANNKGVLVGTFVLTALQQGGAFMGTFVQSYIPGFNADLIIYAEYIIEAAILLVFLMFRPNGLLPEKPVKTIAYEFFKFGKAPIEESEGTKEKGDESKVGSG